MKARNIMAAAMLATTLASCDKVSMTGVLIGGTSADDRVKMSYMYYRDHLGDGVQAMVDSDYSFLVGSDSHVTNDTNRMAEMLKIGLDNNDLLYAHLGDIADTKAEYYIKLENTINTFKSLYIEKHFTYDPTTDKYTMKDDAEDIRTFDQIVFPFFPVVGNHDITHNGWALFSAIFHSSFYDFYVIVDSTTNTSDHFIFLDSANGTFGDYQTDLIDEGILNANRPVRHTFVFTHTNFFRPSGWQFSSTYPREELYYMLNKLAEWNTTIMFCGHVHAWDDREFGGVRYLTLEAMSESNSPNPGDYLVRVHCKQDGTVSYEKVHMSYTPNK